MSKPSEVSPEYRFMTSSSHCPQSNGFIESRVKIVKNTLKKAKGAHTDPNIAMVCLLNTPINNKLPSPAELLVGRTNKK